MAVHFPKADATFIHVPKTGGTSFYDWISRNVVDYDQQPNNNYEHGSIDGARRQWGNLGTIFSFARNPYSRLVSMYLYQYNEATNQIKAHQEGKAISGSLLDHLKLIAVSKKGFDYWVKCICADSEEIYSIYDGDPSTILVSSWYNGTVPNIIIKTEELNTEFYKIADLLTNGQSTEPLPWINTTQHTHYRDYYTSETQQLVYNKFKDDLELFRYKF